MQIWSNDFQKKLDSINGKFNNALELLEPGSGDLVGNEEQLTQIEEILQYPETPNPMLIAEQGAGKTATVEHLLYLHQDSYIIVKLNIERLGELGDELVASRIRDIFVDMRRITAEFNESRTDKIVISLFADEIHKLYSYGLVGDVSRAFNAFKDSLARGTFPIIGGTTDYEYAKTINTDPAFVRRWHNVTFDKVDKNKAVLILKKRLETWNRNFSTTINISNEMSLSILKFAQSFIIDQVEPARSLSILESAYTQAKISDDNEIKLSHIKKSLKGIGVNVDIGSQSAVARQIINEEVIGQPLAVEYITTVINRLRWVPRDYKRPLMTLLFVGPTGTGKTQTAKALTKAYYGTEDALITINGGSFASTDKIPELLDLIYNKFIGSRERTLLLDELEKFGSDVLMALMQVIDEGIVTNSNGQSKAINSAILLATSNLGADTFQSIKKEVGEDGLADVDKLRSEYSKKQSTIRESLLKGDVGRNNGLRPEFLERFQEVLPYFSFSKKSIATITDKLLNEFKAAMLTQNVKVRMPKARDWVKEKVPLPYKSTPIAALFTEDIMSGRSDESGARSIKRWIESTISNRTANILEETAYKNVSENEQIVIDIKTNGFASFEKGNGKGKADVIILRNTEEEE